MSLVRIGILGEGNTLLLVRKLYNDKPFLTQHRVKDKIPQGNKNVTTTRCFLTKIFATYVVLRNFNLFHS